jgi:hypothetical protein
MECTITWNNVGGLMNISHKLCVPSLQRECLTFLLTHAAGKPIKAMRIAEIFEEEELYRESSRFVLDNPGGWTEQELNTLSQETLLKLEKRYVHPQTRLLSLTFVGQEKLVFRACFEARVDYGCKRVSMCKSRISVPKTSVLTLFLI